MQTRCLCGLVIGYAFFLTGCVGPTQLTLRPSVGEARVTAPAGWRIQKGQAPGREYDYRLVPADAARMGHVAIVLSTFTSHTRGEEALHREFLAGYRRTHDGSATMHEVGSVALETLPSVRVGIYRYDSADGEPCLRALVTNNVLVGRLELLADNEAALEAGRPAFEKLVSSYQKQ